MVPACVNNYKSKKATSLWRLFVNRIAGSEQTVRGSGHCNNVKGKLRSHNKQLVPERFALAELSCFHFSPSVVVFTFRDKVKHGFQWRMKTRANKHTLTYREMFLLMGRFYVSFLFFIPFYHYLHLSCLMCPVATNILRLWWLQQTSSCLCSETFECSSWEMSRTFLGH